ncbi:hypothetical protein Bca101_035645 [Brassica carinata]
MDWKLFLSLLFLLQPSRNKVFLLFRWPSWSPDLLFSPPLSSSVFHMSFFPSCSLFSVAGGAPP